MAPMGELRPPPSHGADGELRPCAPLPQPPHASAGRPPCLLTRPSPTQQAELNLRVLLRLPSTRVNGLASSSMQADRATSSLGALEDEPMRAGVLSKMGRRTGKATCRRMGASQRTASGQLAGAKGRDGSRPAIGERRGATIDGRGSSAGRSRPGLQRRRPRAVAP
ncbi:unnamed protein product [Urochloa humidicola]